ncbi:MAG: radical SAM protein [Microthrixaceae bacterium]
MGSRFRRGSLKAGLRSLVAVAQPTGGPSVCNAPSASLYLDQRGDVRACCQNAGFPLGNITQNSLREIWDGEKSRRLRSAVDAGDLSLGCNFCRWQTEEGSADAVFARTFDHLGHGGTDPQWPQQLELSLSNACNLQCVMCNGEWSSSIRAHREKLPPLPVVYDDRFFDDLAEFLPHLKVVKFLGGEPFLGSESLRVMEMLAELGTDIPVHITTNGTQWSPRIQRILDKLRVYAVVSMDGVTKQTYESIRVGSSLDTVVANIDNFIEYSRTRGTSFSLSHCLMPANWSEFTDFLLFAEERGCTVWVNTVTEPYSMSLYHLRPKELREVVSGLESSDAGMDARLTGRRLQVWKEQLARLKMHLESLETHNAPAYIAKRRQLGFAWLAPPERAEQAHQLLEAETQDSSGVLVRISSAGNVDELEWRGEPADDFVDLVESQVAVGDEFPDHLSDPDYDDDGSVVRSDFRKYVLSGDPATAQARETRLALAQVAVRDTDGVIQGSLTWIHQSSSAHRTAVALMTTDSRIAGFTRDEDGQITAVIEDSSSMFGRSGDQLLGTPVEALAQMAGRDANSSVVPVGEVVQLDGVRHYRSDLVEPDGRVAVIEVLEETVGDTIIVWVVRHPAT